MYYIYNLMYWKCRRRGLDYIPRIRAHALILILLCYPQRSKSISPRIMHTLSSAANWRSWVKQYLLKDQHSEGTKRCSTYPWQFTWLSLIWNSGTKTKAFVTLKFSTQLFTAINFVLNLPRNSCEKGSGKTIWLVLNWEPYDTYQSLLGIESISQTFYWVQVIKRAV